MELPRFLLADNSSVEDAFVLHTDFPRFLLNVHTDEVEWMDDIEDEEDMANQMKLLLEEALAFFDEEMQAYEEDDENGL